MTVDGKNDKYRVKIESPEDSFIFYDGAKAQPYSLFKDLVQSQEIPKNEEEFKLLQGGIKRIGGLILSERYHLDPAIRDSAKAAYAAALLLTHSTEVHRYTTTPIEEWKDATIDKVLSTKFNKLKKTNQKAFFYWWQVDKLLSSIN